ncbi:hypothetical protein BaRGS_00021944 [Batillaria attramentaria]|uniref:Small ribosomal subunit protein mS29 n=1 Tax=Batillaria attramentaria TaxID=370345 RepID=A0ABD0KID6_9CAEN
MDASMRAVRCGKTLRLFSALFSRPKTHDIASNVYSTSACFKSASAKQQHPHVQSLSSCRQMSNLAEQFKAATAAKRQAVNVQTVFRTQEGDPTKQSTAQEGLFYTVPEEDVTRIFQKGLPPHFTRQAKTFAETSFMVRKPALQVIEYLKHLNLDHPAPRFVLYGKRGSGRTLSLAHVLHFGLRDNWVLLYLPWPCDWNKWPHEVSPSPYKSGRMDLPIEAAEWLVSFKAQNAHLLKDIRLSQSYVWTKRETADEGSLLLDVVDFGLNRMKFATDCVGVILKELRKQAAMHKIKLLVAVDGVNAFWNQTSVKNLEREFLMADQFSLVHNFKKMLLSNWTHGAIVCTVDAEANAVTRREQTTPYYLLGKEGFEWLDPFVPVHVPDYTEKEAYSCIEYYLDRNWIQHEAAQTEEGKKELIFLSNKNPFQLMRVCAAK